MTNILYAISNIINHDISFVKATKKFQYNTRINNVGESLENLIKDSLCNSFNEKEKHRIELYNHYFSYLGNQNNPPDLIIKNGDAIEIKKITSSHSAIALNSSYPKRKLYSSDSMITKQCRECEPYWQEKDICYIIGNIDREKKIHDLWFIYGDCYCADFQIYTKIKNSISDGIKNIGLELTSTNEIAKVKKIDPLGVTDLRVRGMWHIDHPSKVFDYTIVDTKKPALHAIMSKEKYDSFNHDIKNNITLSASISEIKIKNPNNPVQLIDAVYIFYEFNK